MTICKWYDTVMKQFVYIIIERRKKKNENKIKKYVCDWLQDCHGIGGDNTTPVKDDTQNVQIEEGYQNGTHTQIIFRRALETCDPRDVTITVS